MVPGGKYWGGIMILGVLSIRALMLILLLFLLVFGTTILLLIFLVVILTALEDKDNKQNKQPKNNKPIIELDQVGNVSQETIKTAAFIEQRNDTSCQNHSLQPLEAQQQKQQQFLAAPKIVINSKSEFEPMHLNEPFRFKDKVPNPQNDERHYLIIGKHTFKKLKYSLDWGIRTKRNQVEQGGVLLGHIAYYNNEIYCFVDDFLLADTTGNSVFVEFTSEMWTTMQSKLTKLNETLDRNEQLVIVGWFHTHPNGLAVFMSGTDMTTQKLNFSQKWQASLVMNPHTNKYRVFFGARATEGKVVLLEN